MAKKLSKRKAAKILKDGTVRGKPLTAKAKRFMRARAAGLPVIGTNGCGVEDAVDDDVTGLLLAQDNLTETLPQAIIELLTDPQRAARMGAAGREKARNHTWDHVAQEMIALYERLLHGN